VRAEPRATGLHVCLCQVRRHLVSLRHRRRFLLHAASQGSLCAPLGYASHPIVPSVNRTRQQTHIHREHCSGAQETQHGCLGQRVESRQRVES